MAKRHNIDTIAEVLIDKLNDMERTAEKIERASKRVLEVDTRELEKILKNNRNTEKAILSDLSDLQHKNRTRLPSWTLILLGVLFLTSIGSMWYSFESQKEYELLKKENQIFRKNYKPK